MLKASVLIGGLCSGGGVVRGAVMGRGEWSGVKGVVISEVSGIVHF